MVGMNQYFEWKLKLAGGKSPGGGHGGSSHVSAGSNSSTDMDIGSLVPIERV